MFQKTLDTKCIHIMNFETDLFKGNYKNLDVSRTRDHVLIKQQKMIIRFKRICIKIFQFLCSVFIL